MSLIETWRNISARIHGLNEAAKLDALLRPGAPTTTGSTKFLQLQAAELFSALRQFRDDYAEQLPPEAIRQLEAAAAVAPNIQIPGTALPFSRGQAGNDLVHLQAIESAVTYSLSGSEERIYSLTERAFQHLQWSLIVDETLRERWGTAFSRGETALEALGAVQLLGHGIFAFKVDARGARTDLVIPDADPAESALYATGIVLTEWKKANDQREADAKFNEAHSQATLYREGPLASIELRRTRYAVVVTTSRITAPPDKEVEGIHYRNINIAIENDVPSKAARRRTPTTI